MVEIKIKIYFIFKTFKNGCYFSIFNIFIFLSMEELSKNSAIFQADQSTFIYAPIDSQIKDIYIIENQLVEDNQLLVSLKSPELNLTISQVKEEIDLVNIKIDNSLRMIYLDPNYWF